MGTSANMATATWQQAVLTLVQTNKLFEIVLYDKIHQELSFIILVISTPKGDLRGTNY